tara:strand:- start:642 stop:980 length:339 start_codon:yes stop_codon:yes gene_type:complete
MKYPRQCNITQEGMTEGWVWCAGTFYTKYLKDTLEELRKNDRDSVLDIANEATESDLESPWESEEFFSALKKANNNQESDEELLTIAVQVDYLYYTEWDDSDLEDLQYDDGK